MQRVVLQLRLRLQGWQCVGPIAMQSFSNAGKWPRLGVSCPRSSSKPWQAIIILVARCGLYFIHNYFMLKSPYCELLQANKLKSGTNFRHHVFPASYNHQKNNLYGHCGHDWLTILCSASRVHLWTKYLRLRTDRGKVTCRHLHKMKKQSRFVHSWRAKSNIDYFYLFNLKKTCYYIMASFLTYCFNFTMYLT